MAIPERVRKLLPSRHFYGRWMGNKVRPRWWSFMHWKHGLRWDPVGRCRFCDHTTPYHYPTCRHSERAKRLAAM